MTWVALTGILLLVTVMAPYHARAGAGDSSTARPRTYYVGPEGNDRNDGLSVRSPKSTFATLLRSPPVLQPGDAIVLMDGNYTSSTTGLLQVRCAYRGSSGPNARDGLPDKPITIRAMNPRRAVLRSDGTTAGVGLVGCEFYVLRDLVVLSDTTASKAFDYTGGIALIDGPTVAGGPIQKPPRHILVEGCLSAFANRYQNVALFAVENGADVTFKNVEGYGYHRHGIALWRSERISVDGAYLNGRAWANVPAGYRCTGCNPTGPDEAIAVYQSSFSAIENVVTDDPADASRGIIVHGGCTYAGNHGGASNLIAGIVSVSSGGVTVNPRAEFTCAGQNTRYPKDNVFRDILVLGSDSDSNAFNLRTAVNTTLKNGTAFGTKVHGGVVVIDDRAVECASIGGCSTTLRDVVSVANTGPDLMVTSGFAANGQCLVERTFTNAAPELPSGCTGGANVVGVTPEGLGVTGSRCVTHCSDPKVCLGAGETLGADVRCQHRRGERRHASMFLPTGTSPPNCTSGLGCKHQFYACGPLVPGVNDIDGDSCFDVHERLNLKSDDSGCPEADCPLGETDASAGSR
jgi:hypothetical protein